MRMVKICFVVSLILNAVLVYGTVSPENAERAERFVRRQVTVTAYSPSPHITDHDPFEMASGKRATVKDLYQLRYVAVSRDLMREFGIKFGDIIYIGFEVQDTTSAKVKSTVDLFMRNLNLARQFGRQTRAVILERKDRSR